MSVVSVWLALYTTHTISTPGPTTHWPKYPSAPHNIGLTQWSTVAAQSFGPTTHRPKSQIVRQIFGPTYHSQSVLQPIDPTSHSSYSDYYWPYILESRNCLAHSQRYYMCSLWNNELVYSYQLLLKSKWKRQPQTKWVIMELSESARKCMANGLPWLLSPAAVLSKTPIWINAWSSPHDILRETFSIGSSRVKKSRMNIIADSRVNIIADKES